VVGIIKQMAPSNKGIILQLGHEFTGFLPALECSTDPEVLNNLSKHFQVGACLECAVIDKSEWLKLSARAGHPLAPEDDLSQNVFLSLLCTSTSECKIQAKPCRGDLIVGRIQRTMKPFVPPALMLELRGGYLGRCCITELNEVDDWVNMPLGHALEGGTGKGEAAVVSGESDMDVEEEDGAENAESNG
jgi:hypothetical protein